MVSVDARQVPDGRPALLATCSGDAPKANVMVQRRKWNAPPVREIEQIGTAALVIHAGV
jgi:hypothetical protein